MSAAQSPKTMTGTRSASIGASAQWWRTIAAARLAGQSFLVRQSSVAELKAREVAVGVSGANSTPAFFTRLLNATLGTRMKPINGYPGQNDVLLAMERREIDGHPSAFFSSVRSTRPNWLRDKTAKAIVQYGAEKLAELPDVPFAPDLVANDGDRLVMQAAFAPLALGRPLLMPPGVAAERVAALRRAFAATMADPDFLAEGERVGLGLNAPRSGEQIQEGGERAYLSPPRVIDRLRQLNAPSCLQIKMSLRGRPSVSRAAPPCGGG